MDPHVRRKLLAVIRSLAKAAKPRRRPPPMQLPDGVGLSYYSALLGIVAPMRAVEAKLLELAKAAQDASGAATSDGSSRSDADKPEAGPMRAAVEAAEAAFDKVLRGKMAWLKRATDRAASGVSDHNRRQLMAQARAQIGIELPFADVPPAMLKRFVRENVDLVTTVPQRYFAQLRALVEDYASTGRRPETLASEIRDRWGVAQSNAARIARHQVSKLNGEINMVRLADAGVEEFIWRDVGDNRVRSEHRSLNGKRFSMADPPDGIIPGEEIGCRCYAEPVFRSAA